MTLKTIACVTGASGLVGSRIARRLTKRGYHVRALSRRSHLYDPDIDVFKGALEDEAVLESFLKGARLLFHCAGELRDTGKMTAVNVDGTKCLVQLAGKLKLQYLCHISSAGVIGRTRNKLVDETTACAPQDPYEISKWNAEKIVSRGVAGCRVVILRPTNIVSDKQPGELAIFRQSTLYSHLKLRLIGGECSHIIHVDNVAAAALHFIDRAVDSPECFFVSADDDKAITFSDLYSLYVRLSTHGDHAGIARPVHLPIFIPYLLRKLLKRSGNMGDVRYTAKKLFLTGFQFPMNIPDTLRQVFHYDE